MGLAADSARRVTRASLGFCENGETRKRCQTDEGTDWSAAGPITGRIRFIVVNDRVSGADARCAVRCEKIERGYIHAMQPRSFYCDARRFAGHEKMAALLMERRARQVS